MNTSKHIKDLTELLRIPSISAQSAHKSDMTKAAKWLLDRLNQLGFASKVMKTAGHPVVFAHRLVDPKAPTILIYGHYDVQSPDPLEQWRTDPFEPIIRNGNIFGRGTADDKGQLYTWFAAIDELNKSNTKLCNLKFLIEGEEEVGSKNLEEFVSKNKKLLKSDFAVVSDTHCLSEVQPVITYGLRGIVYFDLSVRTLTKDVHSGTYGGNVLNPIQILASIITKIKDDNHNILIPDFYENVRRLTPNQTIILQRFPFKEKQIKSETGALVVSGEDKFTTQIRTSSRPAFDVCGIWGGYQGEGPKTIIPARAHAKLSFRIVPNQTSKEIKIKFQKYLKSIMPDGVEYKLDMISDGEPVLFDVNKNYFDIATKAYKSVFGRNPLYFAWGGSIPVTATFKRFLGIDSVLMGYGLPDDGLHSPNEKLSVSMFEKGIRTNMEFLKIISQI